MGTLFGWSAGGHVDQIHCHMETLTLLYTESCQLVQMIGCVVSFQKLKGLIITIDFPT